MITVGEIISDALVELGVIDPTMAMEASQAQHGLRTLNRMIEEWNSQHLMIYTLNRNVFTLVPSQQSYTLGTGGDWNMPRPVRTDMISVIPTGGIPEIPMHEMSDEEWRGIAVKSTTSQFPTQIWFNGNVPLNVAYVWPVPTTACQVVLYTWGRQLVLTDLTTTLQFPDGWEKAIVCNLAIELASSYGVQPQPSLVARAQTSKSSIQSLNSEPLYITSDLSSGYGSIAIMSFGLQVDRM